MESSESSPAMGHFRPAMVVMNPAKPMSEYAVLVATVPVEDVLIVAQLYRDRADVYAVGFPGQAYRGDDESTDVGIRVGEEDAT